MGLNNHFISFPNENEDYENMIWLWAIKKDAVLVKGFLFQPMYDFS